VSGNDNITEVLTLFTPSELVGIDLRGSVAIVIDVLRGSSTIIQALKNGASRIIPASEIEDARAIADEWPTGEYLLCAERNAIKVDGFNLGNSPFEYSAAAVSGKDLIYSSTNCSKALLASYAADRVVVGSFNNLAAVMASAGAASRIFLVCAGKMGRFALEDTVCAGMFVNEFLRDTGREVALNDASRVAKLLFDYYHRDLLKLLRESSHGNYLLSLGLEKDLEFVAQVDSERIVPELSLDKTYFFSTFIPKANDDSDPPNPILTDPVIRTAAIAIEPNFDDFEIREVSSDD
jgi:2-phosphosulfolactate phosphatase